MTLPRTHPGSSGPRWTVYAKANGDPLGIVSWFAKWWRLMSEQTPRRDSAERSRVAIIRSALYHLGRTPLHVLMRPGPDVPVTRTRGWLGQGLSEAERIGSNPRD